MTRRDSFQRKLVYLALMIPLLIVVSLLGQPAVVGRPGVEGESGGKLAQLQDEYDFSPVELGKIDPASETIKLVTFGMRGPAANWLWWKATEYQKKKDWTNLTATLNQLTKVQPNFVKVWVNQGWNLSYNCSVQFDDYRERYHWVIKGVRFLDSGRFYNQFDADLPREVGRIIAYKIGRADEYRQFRQLFIADDDFHGDTPKEERDNWLVGKRWYRDTEAMVESGSPLRTNPLVFYSKAPMCQMAFANVIEEEGTFGEKAKMAWRQALADWIAFGNRVLMTSNGRTTLQLGKLYVYVKELADLCQQLEALAPGEKERILADRMAKLTPEQRAALDLVESGQPRTPEQETLAMEARAVIQITADEIARLCADREKANDLLRRIKDKEEVVRLTGSHRGVVNFEYWERRAGLEQSPELLDARKTVFEADQALAESDISAAIRGYEKASLAWRLVLEKNEFLLTREDQPQPISGEPPEDDDETVDAMEHLMSRYGRALDQRDEVFPEDFPLSFVVAHQVWKNPRAAEARRKRAKAEKALAEGDLNPARETYKELISDWQGTIEDLPHLEQMANREISQEILNDVNAYAKALGRLKLPVPENFPLQRFIWVQVEHDQDARKARESIDHAIDLAEKGDAGAAREAFQTGLNGWAVVVDRYPTIVSDKSIRGEIQTAIDGYRAVLKKLGATLPEPLPVEEAFDRQDAGKGK